MAAGFAGGLLVVVETTAPRALVTVTVIAPLPLVVVVVVSPVAAEEVETLLTMRAADEPDEAVVVVAVLRGAAETTAAIEALRDEAPAEPVLLIVKFMFLNLLRCEIAAIVPRGG